MPMNSGSIELATGNGVVARVYYDTAFTPVGPDQPLINGPRGWCLDLTNATGAKASVTITGPSGNPVTISVGQGDPVVSGPASGRSRTAAQMAALGLTKRGDLNSIQLS